ncbi:MULTISPECIES: amidase [Ramlibacter]|uniref:Amidase n=1 Tax=Ramlibacter pinisoli TaxID=2682844 RepID=A0A6N8J1L2_9BURK|nr:MULTISPECIES: amidase [Ramlibacter]MBA2962750.1 amidase [Ramlibacter sp. CGMCC 1.13660]MVQ32692.1 amidase [Ramlibacter pinisoli]
MTTTSDAFPIDDRVGAWVPHGRHLRAGAATGPLAGLRFGVKDLFDVAGWPTGAGNPRWLATHPVPGRSSPLVEQLLAAGATCVGKLLTDELAYSIHGDNAHYGTPLNLAAPGRVPGGSSSGSAAAVAARLVDFALGTDTGGSTRVPASYCGLWGLRPTHGLLSQQGLVPLHPGFDTPTWLAHAAPTFARVGAVLLPPAPPRAWRRAQRWQAAWEQADAVFQAPLQAAWQALQDLGLERDTVPADAFAPDAWRQAYVAAGAREAWQAHGAWITGADPGFAPAVAQRFQFASGVTEAQAQAGRSTQTAVRGQLRDLLGSDGVALVPSAASVAPLRTADPAEVDAVRLRTLRITCLAGLAGLPQVSLPCRTPDGLPIGLSLVGPAGSDAALIALAQRLHARLPAALTGGAG